MPVMAQDQREAKICDLSSTEMTSLRTPMFGAAASVWDIVEGEEGMDVYNDVISLPDNNYIAAGTFTKDKGTKVFQPLIVKFDDTLAKVWETRDTTGPYKTIQRILPIKDGFAVLGNVREANNGDGIYIGFYDANGKFLKDKKIFETNGKLDAKAMVLARDGSGFMVAAQQEEGKSPDQQYGVIYKLSPSGDKMWKRSYRPGLSSVFQNIQVGLKGDYFVTGQLVTDDRKSAGWVLRVDGKGVIQWQQTYPRGLAASLSSVQENKYGALTMVGQVRPLSGVKDGLAAWVIKTDPSGKLLWQRYFRSVNYDFKAVDAIVYEDGRSSVLINGTGLSPEYIAHASLLTFSPQGQLQGLEEFTNGQNALANRMVSGMNAERIIAGYSQTSFGEGQEMDEPAPVSTLDGWLFAAVPLELYEDPCRFPDPPSPILR